MKEYVKRLCLISALFTGLLTLTGCVALLVGGAAAAGGVFYVKGELKADVDASVEQTAQAVEVALEELELTRLISESDSLTGHFKAEDARDRTVDIKLRYKTDEVTNVRIRIGTFGDEALSRKILDEIKANL